MSQTLTLVVVGGLLVLAAFLGAAGGIAGGFVESRPGRWRALRAILLALGGLLFFVPLFGLIVGWYAPPDASYGRDSTLFGLFVLGVVIGVPLIAVSVLIEITRALYLAFRQFPLHAPKGPAEYCAAIGGAIYLVSTFVGMTQQGILWRVAGAGILAGFALFMGGFIALSRSAKARKD